MPEETELERGRSIAERLLGGWRVVASAWAMAIVVVLLFAGVQAVASFHGVSPRQQSLAGAVIPQHNPSCSAPRLGPNASPNCDSEYSVLGTAESATYYGW